jgi:zinc/manganese transport system substrate-binding protein
MTSFKSWLLVAALGVWAAPALAALNVFATVPEWGALVEELGGDKVKVYTATNALQDPHHVEAKPSLIARARGAAGPDGREADAPRSRRGRRSSVG